jgi:hypothetical protein
MDKPPKRNPSVNRWGKKEPRPQWTGEKRNQQFIFATNWRSVKIERGHCIELQRRSNVGVSDRRTLGYQVHAHALPRQQPPLVGLREGGIRQPARFHAKAEVKQSPSRFQTMECSSP